MRTKSDIRRQAILAAAKAVFEEVGFEQATMSEITARACGSKATLYRYFDSKEALFIELVQSAATQHCGQLMALLHPGAAGTARDGMPSEVSETLSLLKPDEDVTVTLQGFGERVFKTFYSPQKLAARRMVIAAANHSQIGRLFYENGPAQGMKYLEAYFAGVMHAGKLRPADPRVVAAHFRGLLEGEIYEPALLNALPELSDDELAAIVRRAVDVFMLAYGAHARR